MGINMNDNEINELEKEIFQEPKLSSIKMVRSDRNPQVYDSKAEGCTLNIKQDSVNPLSRKLLDSIVEKRKLKMMLTTDNEYIIYTPKK